MFCKNTIKTVLLEINEIQKQLDIQLENEEREEINVTLRKNEEINWKQEEQDILQQEWN